MRRTRQLAAGRNLSALAFVLADTFTAGKTAAIERRRKGNRYSGALEKRAASGFLLLLYGPKERVGRTVSLLPLAS